MKNLKRLGAFVALVLFFSLFQAFAMAAVGAPFWQTLLVCFATTFFLMATIIMVILSMVYLIVGDDLFEYLGF